jgi:hypothetical protein
MENIKKASGFTGTDPGTVSGDASLDVVGIMNAESRMTSDVKIPEGIDMSKVDLTNLQLGDNFGEYKDNESLKQVAIANTDRPLRHSGGGRCRGGCSPHQTQTGTALSMKREGSDGPSFFMLILLC